MDLTEIVHFDNAHRHPWELARYIVIKDFIKKMVQSMTSDSVTILDLGCGDAYLVHRLALDFPSINFIGVDINFTEELLRQLQKNIKAENLTLHPHLSEIKLPPDSIDLVLLLDVIEHINDEVSFLKSLSGYAFISRNATFLITVPAYQWLFAAHDVVLEHYRRYSNHSLRLRLQKAGYTTSYERYFFLTLIPPRILQVLKEKLITSNTERASDLAAWKGGHLITSLIKNILVFDYKLGTLFRKIGIKLPGLSNLVICQRSV